MSFSLDSKQELCNIIPNKKCCRIAELSALIKSTGTIHLTQGQMSIKLDIENASIAKKIFILLKKVFGISVEMQVKKNYYFNKHNTYVLIITEDMGLKNILIETKILSLKKDKFDLTCGISEDLLKNSCCKRAYLRGAFLGSASMSNPERTYHLEFVTSNIEFAKDLTNILGEFDLNARYIKRKNHFIIYIKEGEQIIDLLNIIGAHSSLLDLENIRVFKEIRNNINRVVNCETANLKKTADASVRQINNIKLIDEKLGLDSLPKRLRDVAKIRLQYTEASLQELGEMISPPISKSGINHRLRKLEQIAEGLKE